MTEKTPIDDPIITLRQISYTYPGSTCPVLNDLDLIINQGDRIGMMAPNGSGKTTLLHTMMGLCHPESGSVQIFGKTRTTEDDFLPVRAKIGLLFQDSDDQLFCPTVLEDVAFGPLNLGLGRDEAMARAEQVLEDLGITDLDQSVTHRLSGGQKRLVALAAVLAMKPDVLLLDEPTAGLDAAVQTKLEDILNRLEITYFVISHDFDFINAVTDKIYSMEEGKILTDDDVHIHKHEHVHKHRHGKHPHVHQ